MFANFILSLQQFPKTATGLPPTRQVHKLAQVTKNGRARLAKHRKCVSVLALVSCYSMSVCGCGWVGSSLPQ